MIDFAASSNDGEEPDKRIRRADFNQAKRKSHRDVKARPVENPARRAACESDDVLFLRTYLPDAFYNPFSVGQVEYIEEIGRCLKFGTRKALAAPRGSGKSTILKYLLLKYALYRQIRFPLLIGATHVKALQSLKDVKAKLRAAGDSPLRADFPFECDIFRYVSPAPNRVNSCTFEGAPVEVVWKPDLIVFPSLPDGCQHAGPEHGLPASPTMMGPVIMSLPWTSDALQGCNVNDVRPDFVLLDDLDSRDSLAAEHGTIAEKICDCLDKTIAGLGGPNRRLGQVFLCTITSRKAAAYIYTDPKRKPAWDGERRARITVWPDAMEMWDKYIQLRMSRRRDDPFGRVAFNYLQENFRAMHEGAVVSTPYDYNIDQLEDGLPEHLSALQKCFDFIADNGRAAFDTEHQNDPPPLAGFVANELTPAHVYDCIGQMGEGVVDLDTRFVVRAIDIRKTELHSVCLARGERVRNRIYSYDVLNHASQEITVEQAEASILAGLERLAEDEGVCVPVDGDGVTHGIDLTLIDKGWVGSWKVDGQWQQWQTQPVETFCMTRGLRRYLPCKGAPNYREPAPGDSVIIGNHWHMNRGEGKERRCTELIWDPIYWRSLVQDLFLLPAGEDDRFDIFIPPDKGVKSMHKLFGEHMRAGSRELREMIARGGRKDRKMKAPTDHWWDCTAMGLLALDVEAWFRVNVKPVVRVKPKASESQEPAAAAGRGARRAGGSIFQIGDR